MRNGSAPGVDPAAALDWIKRAIPCEICRSFSMVWRGKIGRCADGSRRTAYPAGSPADPRQEHVARLRRQADNLDRTITALETRLQDAEAARLDVGPLLAEAKKKFDASEERISNALTEKGRGGQAHLDKENGRAYVEKVQLEERKKQLGRTQEALHALLAPARKDLLDIQRQLAEADARPPPGTNLRSLSNTSSARQAAADMELLVDALGGEGAAVERLVERAGRRTPHTLAGWLRRPFSKGAPKPLKGKRQDAFMQLVHSDVMKVARHGEIPPLQAADLVLEGVESTALGADLAPQDREHLLASLRQLREELADPQARQPQPGQGTQGMLRTA